MKFIILCLLGAVLIAGVTSQGAQSECPAVCPQLYGPVCARNSAGEDQTFDNECIMRARNCANKSDFVKQRSGTC